MECSHNQEHRHVRNGQQPVLPENASVHILGISCVGDVTTLHSIGVVADYRSIGVGPVTDRSRQEGGGVNLDVLIVTQATAAVCACTIHDVHIRACQRFLLGLHVRSTDVL